MKIFPQTCLSLNQLRTAGSYLLVLHNLEQLDENNTEAVRLLAKALEGNDWQLCKELLRFLHSIDDTGQALKNALSQVDLVHPEGTKLLLSQTTLEKR